MNKLQQKIVNWADEKGLTDPVKQTLKTLSEAGELADAVCESRLDDQTVHYNELLDNGELDDIIDAIGDIEVCLTILKNQLGLNMDYPLESAYEVIKHRTGKTINGTFAKD